MQSHALSFFYLSSPDLLLGMDADPAKRNIFGVMEANPAIARDGIRLRQFGQQIIEWLAGKRIHPSWVVPGGVNEPLTAAHRDQHPGRKFPKRWRSPRRTLDWFKGEMEQFREEIRSFANFPTLFMGLVGADGGARSLRRQAALRGRRAARWWPTDIDPADYAEYIAEMAHPWTYLKTSLLQAAGLSRGHLPRGTAGAPEYLRSAAARRWPARSGPSSASWTAAPVLSSFYYHYARLIEILYALEKMEQLLNEPEILDTHVRAHASANNSEGVGVAEAPRGTLIHHYKVDRDGLITLGQPDHRHRTQQRGHEPRRVAGGAPLRARQQAHRRACSTAWRR